MLKNIILFVILLVVLFAIALLATHQPATTQQPSDKTTESPACVMTINDELVFNPDIDIFWSWEVGKILDGNETLQEWIKDLNITAWVKVRVTSLIQPRQQISAGNNCTLKLYSSMGAFIEAKVLDVIWGNQSLLGETVVLYLPVVMSIDGKIIHYCPHIYPILPEREYVVPIGGVPKGISASIVYLCNGTAYVYGRDHVNAKIKVYMVRDYFTIYYIGCDGKVYNLAVSNKIGTVDSTYSRIYHESLTRNPKVIKETLLDGSTYETLEEAIKSAYES